MKLTENQKEVLRWLVNENRNGQHNDEFIIGWGDRPFVTYEAEDRPPPYYMTRGVLEVLAQAELIVLSSIPNGVRVGITGTAEWAVDSDFSQDFVTYEPVPGSQERKYSLKQVSTKDLHRLVEILADLLSIRTVAQRMSFLSIAGVRGYARVDLNGEPTIIAETLVDGLLKHGTDADGVRPMSSLLEYVVRDKALPVDDRNFIEAMIIEVEHGDD